MLSVENNLRKAKKYLERADFENAEKIYDQILKKYPSNLRAKEGKTNIYNLNLAKNNQIIQDYNKKLLNLYKSKKYDHKRISQVAMIIRVRLRVLKQIKNKHY